MPGYLTAQHDVAIAGSQGLVIRSLLDRQQFSDPHGLAERLGVSSAAWPMFGLLWPSAGLLAEHMSVRPVREAERILEVGCGLALASLVAHRRGADITASDRHPLAEAFLLENLRLNGLPPMKYRHGDWAAAAAPAGAAQVAVPAVVQGLFDLLIGSDVLYDRDASVALAGFVGRHAARRAEVWIVDPHRGNRVSFSRCMEARGFRLQQERLDRVDSPRGPAYVGRLLCYRRQGDAGPGEGVR